MINKEELKQIQGGGFSIGLGILFGGIATFLIGLVDGQIKLK